MKTYIIGRQEDCDIVISDPTQMVSRHHAVLSVNGSKMTITDQSSNGTYINGIRIATGAPVPVTRKDVVSFAQAAELNWSRIPDPSRKTLASFAIIAVVLLLAGIGGKLGYDAHQSGMKEQETKVKQDSVQLAKISTDIVALTKDYEFIKHETDSLNKKLSEVQVTIDKKQPSNELNAINRDYANWDLTLKNIKLVELNDKLISLKTTADYEKNLVELGKKVKELQDLTQNYKQIIKQVSSGLKEIETKLDKLPNKKAPGNNKNDKDKEKEKPANVIMSVDQDIVL